MFHHQSAVATPRVLWANEAHVLHICQLAPHDTGWSCARMVRSCLEIIKTGKIGTNDCSFSLSRSPQKFPIGFLISCQNKLSEDRSYRIPDGLAFGRNWFFRRIKWSGVERGPRLRPRLPLHYSKMPKVRTAKLKMQRQPPMHATNRLPLSRVIKSFTAIRDLFSPLSLLSTHIGCGVYSGLGPRSSAG